MAQKVQTAGSAGRNSLIVIIVCLLLTALAGIYFRSNEQEVQPDEYAEYENGKVIAILKDSTFIDPDSDNGYRGEQMLTVEVTTGQYKGETLLVYNYISPLYGVPVEKGDSVTMIISTYKDGSHTATVYEYNHLPGIIILFALFILACVFVGGRNGAKSLIGLCFILVNIFFVLLPALMKGAPTILTTFLVAVVVSAFGLTVMSGVNKKTVCAFLGTVSGVAVAFLFAWGAQKLLRISGLRADEVEGLLQLRQTGTPIRLRGLLSAGIIISSIGAVMDVTMGLASAAAEIHEADRKMSVGKLFASGMNIGKDMVGTMTSTLILAFLGSSFVLILYLYSLSLGKYQFLSSAYFAIEIINGLSTSIGAILSIPITAFISARAFGSSADRS